MTQMADNLSSLGDQIQTVDVHCLQRNRLAHVQDSHSTPCRDLLWPRSTTPTSHQVSTTLYCSDAAAAELGSDKFTARLKPSELMKLGHPCTERCIACPLLQSSRMNKKSATERCGQPGMDRIWHWQVNIAGHADNLSLIWRGNYTLCDLHCYTIRLETVNVGLYALKNWRLPVHNLEQNRINETEN